MRYVCTRPKTQHCGAQPGRRHVERWRRWAQCSKFSYRYAISIFSEVTDERRFSSFGADSSMGTEPSLARVQMSSEHNSHISCIQSSPKPQPRIRTSFEALWRTLIADCWKGKHPAPPEAGFAFVDRLIWDIQSLSYLASKADDHGSSDTTGNKEYLAQDLKRRLAIINALAS